MRANTTLRADEAAYCRFLKLRWPDTDGSPICPRCGSVKVYLLCTERRFRCAECKRHFSATSGTIFSNRKLSYAKLLALLQRRDLNALQISKDLGMQYKAAWVLCQKLREAYARGGAVAQQPHSSAVGYFQHTNAKPDGCSRCSSETHNLQRRTFEFHNQLSGWFCADCLGELEQLNSEMRQQYENSRTIKHFKGELDEHAKEHG
jgi:transposase-like protein